MPLLRPLDPAFPIDRQLAVDATPVVLVNLVFRERGILTSGNGSRTMVHAIDCEGGGSAARS